MWSEQIDWNRGWKYDRDHISHGQMFWNLPLHILFGQIHTKCNFEKIHKFAYLSRGKRPEREHPLVILYPYVD